MKRPYLNHIESSLNPFFWKKFRFFRRVFEITQFTDDSISTYFLVSHAIWKQFRRSTWRCCALTTRRGISSPKRPTNVQSTHSNRFPLMAVTRLSNSCSFPCLSTPLLPAKSIRAALLILPDYNKETLPHIWPIDDLSSSIPPPKLLLY